MSYGMIQNNKNSTDLLNQLKNSTKQYKILNKDEERELINKYRNNRDELNRLLFMHNIRLVFNMSRKYATKVDDFDALISDGMCGLATACQRFDIDRGIKFSTYCVPWIFKFMVANFYSKQHELEKVTTSLNSAVKLSKSKSNSDNEVTFENFVNEYIDPSCNTQHSIESTLSSDEMTDICKKLIHEMNEDTSLSATDKSVFIDSFYNREKTKDIASKYDMTAKEVNQIRNKILSKFKDILSKTYNINSIEDIKMN